MSESTASLRHKISSAEDLQSVVRTMKAVAASSIGQYEQSVLALNDYYRTVEMGIGLCLREMGKPLRKSKNSTKATDPVGVIVFGSDQGLVGQFNEALADYVLQTLPPNATIPPEIWAVGERLQGRLAEAGLTEMHPFAVPQSVKAITPLVSEILMASETRHSEGHIAELMLFYNSPTAGAVYTPVHQSLLPLDAHFRQQEAQFSWPGGCLPRVVGDKAATLRVLIGEHLFVSLFRACAESLASENASRLAAMQRADKNIDELLDTLQGDFHRLRQSGIDEELFDVIAGFEALKG